MTHDQWTPRHHSPVTLQSSFQMELEIFLFLKTGSRGSGTVLFLTFRLVNHLLLVFGSITIENSYACEDIQTYRKLNKQSVLANGRKRIQIPSIQAQAV